MDDDVEMSTDTGDSGSSDISDDGSSDFDDSYDDADIDTDDIDEDVSDEEIDDTDELDEIDEDVSDEEFDDTDADSDELEEIDEDISDEELDDTDANTDKLDEVDEDVSDNEFSDTDADTEELEMSEDTADTSANDEADTAEDTADTDTEEPEMTEDTADTSADDEANTTEDTADTNSEEPEMTENTTDTSADDEADTTEDTADTDTEEPEMTEVTDDTAADDESDTAEDTTDTDTEEPEMTEETDYMAADDEADTVEDTVDTNTENPKMAEKTNEANDSNETQPKHGFKDWVNPHNYDEDGHYIGEKKDFGYKPHIDGQEVDTSTYRDYVEQQAASSVSEYMSKHGYGRDDFATYSQDPEWRNLMRTEYPDYELPELTQENAKSQLSDYMNSHNYGQDDIDTYSQDPIWRELQSAAYPDYELPALRKELTDTQSKELINGKIPSELFASDTSDSSSNADTTNKKTRLEDLTETEYEEIKKADPKTASKLLTDFNERNIKPDDLSELSRTIEFDSGSKMEVVDNPLTSEYATFQNTDTKEQVTVYPNPMGRMSHMMGRQGQNDIGMHQDCGIASTAKGINDLYGREVTSENRLANYALETQNCGLDYNNDGTVDYYNSGGTYETNVREFYEANGLEADEYMGNGIPDIDYVGEQIKNGGVATMAVNHDLMWNYDKAVDFDPSTVDMDRYQSDSRYADRVNTYMSIKNGNGVFKADHFVNVSNAVYNNDGQLTHFIVSDTGNGTTKMIPKEYLSRAYMGSGKMRISAQGCVIARRK